jgi:hypothetical protein
VWRASTIAKYASQAFGSFANVIARPASVLDFSLKNVRDAHSVLPPNVPIDAPDKRISLPEDGGQHPAKHERQQAILTDKVRALAPRTRIS